MRLAIMQPYIFPYIGYFQLINAVDKFVIFDDVNFIKKGWINRNRILQNNSANVFTVPLVKASQNRLINSIQVSNDIKWKEKLSLTLQHSYGKAPFFNTIYKMVMSVFESEADTISELAYMSLKIVCDYLDIKIKFVFSSEYNNKHMKGQDRIIDICLLENTTQYINAFGGKELYSPQAFQEKGIELFFVKTKPYEYKQFNNPFVSNLSIIDILMFNEKERVQELLGLYELVN